MPWDINASFIGWLAYYIYFIVLFSNWYFVNALYLSLYLTITLDFFGFRKQYESLSAKLKEETEKWQQINQMNAKAAITKLTKHHVFVKQ